MTREMTRFCKIMTEIVIAGSFALLNVWNYLSMHFYHGEYLVRLFRDKEPILYFFTCCKDTNGSLKIKSICCSFWFSSTSSLEEALSFSQLKGDSTVAEMLAIKSPVQAYQFLVCG